MGLINNILLTTNQAKFKYLALMVSAQEFNLVLIYLLCFLNKTNIETLEINDCH